MRQGLLKPLASPDWPHCQAGGHAHALMGRPDRLSCHGLPNRSPGEVTKVTTLKGGGYPVTSESPTKVTGYLAVTVTWLPFGPRRVERVLPETFVASGRQHRGFHTAPNFPRWLSC